MKIACIGDVHGTPKFLECYERIKEKDNDVDRIIVFGDHFDPYEDIPFETMLDRYHKFIECCKSDNRIISLLGNHDLEEYVIAGGTNRTTRDRNERNIISEEIGSNLPDSYLVYKVGNWLFSHAGVSQTWLDMNEEYKEDLLSNRKGWDFKDLDILCAYYDGDWSGYGNNVHQGCTWIRPHALLTDLPKGFNQVISHTRVERIVHQHVGEERNDIWLIDNCGESEYVVINVEEE